MSETLLIKSADDLEQIKKQFQNELGKYKFRVLVCSGGGCISANCHAVKDALLKSIKENGL